MTEPQLYNSRIVQIYLNLLRAKYPEVDVGDILDRAGIKPYEAADGAYWFTQSQVDRFHERMVQLTGNPDIGREGGRYAASRDSLGTIEKYVLGLIGPANAFITINKSSSSFTRSSRFESKRLAPNQIEITVTPAQGVRERRFQCENRVGFFEAILASFNCDDARIEHPECCFNGGSCCRYIVSWRNSLPSRLRVLRNVLALPLAAACLLLAPRLPAQGAWLAALAASLLFALGHLASHLEKQELHAALANLKESTDELLEQTAVNYSNALMVNEVGQAISKQSDQDEVLANIIHTLENRLGYDRGMILLADAQRTRLTFRVGFGYSESELELLKGESFRLDNAESSGVFVTCFWERKPILINDFSEVADRHSPHSIQFAQRMGAQAFICCAIVCEGESLGVLAMDNVLTKKPLVGSDISLLMGIAPVIGMSIRNAIYIDRERRMAEQLRQSQKMETIGQVTSGVAHDFNNLLTAIAGFANLAQENLEPGCVSRQYLDEVLLTSERATYLTRGLLSFGRKEDSSTQPADVNVAVEKIEKLLRRLMSRQVELRILLGEGELTVLASPGQIDQVIMNLATNARDAMDNAGILTIATGRAEITTEVSSGRGTASPGSYARISVSDTGQGMDEATRSRLFEPFFTTKGPGQGTGLGLSIVHRIVQQVGGFIEVASVPGEGTGFHVYLPLTEPPPADGEAVTEHGTAS